MLYLVKASRVREFRLQNVEILSAPDGRTIPVAYKRRWIQPGLTPKVGDGCVVVFADSPYDCFVPVRFGTLSAIEEDDVALQLAVRLGHHVVVDDPNVLTTPWTARTQGRPGKELFLLEDENPGIRAHIGPEGAVEAWRSAIDRLAKNPYFASSTVIRVAAVLDARGIEVATDQPVSVPATVRLTLELRTPVPEQDEVEVVTEAEPAWAIAHRPAVAAPSNGMTDVAVELVGDGGVDLSLRVSPNTLFSSRPRFHIETAPTPQAPTAVTELGQALPVRELVRFLQRESALSDDGWIRLYDGLLLAVAPDDRELLLDFARRCFSLGRWDDVFEALRDLRGLSPADEHLLLVAGIRGRRRLPIAEHLERIDLNEEHLFKQLVEATSDADPSTLEALVDELAEDRLGADKTVRFLTAAFGAARDSDLMVRCALGVAHHDLEVGASLLLDEWPYPEEMPPRALDALVCEIRTALHRLGPYLRHHAVAAIAEGETGKALDDVKLVRRMPASEQRLRLLGSIGLDLLATDDRPSRSEGFGLLCEIVEAAASQGLLDIAADHAEAIVGYAEVLGDEVERDAAQDLRGRVTAALEDSEVLLEWRRMRTEGRYADVREALRGRRLHLVGGAVSAWARDLEELLGLAELRWHETEKGRSPRTDWADGLETERDIVVVLTNRIGHDVTKPLRDACRRRSVQYVHASWGFEAVLRELDEACSSGTPK